MAVRIASYIGLAVAVGLAIFFAREVLLLGFFAIVLGTLMSFAVNFFARALPRGLAVLLTLILMLGSGVTLTVLAVPTVSRQVEQLRGQIPVATEKLRALVSQAEQRAARTVEGEGSAKAPKLGPQLAAGAENAATQLAKQAIPFAINVVQLVTTMVLVFVLAAFLVYEPRQYRDGLRTLVPRAREADFDECWNRVTIGLRHWVGGVFVEMVIMGTLAGLGLWLAGIDGALTLGLLTFFATFVPYLGAIASSVPGLLMGLARSPEHFLYAGLVYIGVHIVEGYILSPLIMRRAIQLRPGLLLFWEALMGTLFGVAGIVVATPLLAAVKVLVGYFYIEGRLGKEGPRI